MESNEWVSTMCFFLQKLVEKTLFSGIKVKYEIIFALMKTMLSEVFMISFFLLESPYMVINKLARF
jgi:hypothetical protein